MIITLAGIVIIILGLVLTFKKTARKNQDGVTVFERRKGMPILIIVGAAVLIIGLSFKIVPTGYTGVRVTFGQVSDEIVPQGFNFKVPFIQEINLVNNKQQDAVVSAQVWGETLEKTPVYASDIIVTYQISSARSAWIYANVTDYDGNLIDDNLVSSAVKSAMVELGSGEVTNRTRIEPMAKEKLALSLEEKYGAGTITVLKVVINNMDFEQSYNDAISAKSIAQQNYEKQQIENETAISRAQAEKNVAITNAEAEAQSMLIEAQAQADANKILSESLTDNVLRYQFYENWNGQLPQVMGENSVIMDIGQLADGQQPVPEN